MIQLNNVRFDTSGWDPVSEDETARIWRNSVPDELSVHYFSLPPDIPAPLANLTALRDGYRDLVLEAGQGLIMLDVLRIRGIEAVKLIAKAPQQPWGMAYVGSLTFPFATFSFVVKVQSPEHGLTGMREAVVFDRWMKMHPPDPATLKEGPIPGWAADPYDASRQDPVMRNPAEDEAFDAIFPTHPLSRVRGYLATIEASLQFDDVLYRANPSIA